MTTTTIVDSAGMVICECVCVCVCGGGGGGGLVKYMEDVYTLNI